MADSEAESDTVLDAEMLAVLAASIGDRDLPAERKASIKARIQARIQAPAPEGTHTVRAGEGRWRSLAPGIDIKILHLDSQQKTQTSLWRLAPGAVLVEHQHRSDEECLVLEGEVHMGEYYVRAGDYHLAKAGHSHPRLETTNGALLLIRGEMHEALVSGLA
jgi:quercetin dioxygenase-like cupin family protein